MTAKTPEIAVLVPCYNEVMTVAQVVADFRKVLPRATIYVYDNNSKDGTSEAARAAGAVVRLEKGQGKGNVVRRMFADIEADIYVMVDGDATYHAPSAIDLIRLLTEQNLDMVNGARVDTSVKAYRFGHRFGNQLLTGLVSKIFGQETTDMLSGFKVFSRRYAKSFPAHSRGFEIETELMVHALELRMGIGEMPTPYAERPEGSVSKLNTIRDGIRILSMIGLFVKEERPVQVFSSIATVMILASLTFGIPVLLEFIDLGTVKRVPSAVAAMGLTITGMLSLFAGLILDTVTRGRREMKRLAYLQAGMAYKNPLAEIESLSIDELKDALKDLGPTWEKSVKRAV
jgi:hypothetical protein